MKVLGLSLTCSLLARCVDAAKIQGLLQEAFWQQVHKKSLSTATADGDEEWCSENVFPFPDKQYDAKGSNYGENVFGKDDLAALRAELAKNPNWQADHTWEFKAKVVVDSFSGTLPELSFGFPGGRKGGFLKFQLAKREHEQVVQLKDAVQTSAGEAELDFLAEGNLLSSVIFSQICLRPALCSNFKGCLPSLQWQNKVDGTGSTIAQCCEERLCKEALTGADNDGCAPSTQWKKHEAFDTTRRGNTLERCCVPILCDDSYNCSGTKIKRRQGTGILGSTEEECCEPVYCHELSGVCDSLKDQADPNNTLRGSTKEECCDALKCEDFDCSADGKWRNKTDFNGTAHTFTECCDPNYCAEFDGCKNNTKYLPDPHSPLQGGTAETCCKPRLCTAHTCSSQYKPLTSRLLRGRLGSTDIECCEPKLCKAFDCNPHDKWTKKPELIDIGNNRQVARVGFNHSACCEPRYCRDFVCSGSKWKNKADDVENDTLGSTPQVCCQPQYCRDYTCTSDYNGDGNGTMYYKRLDTNAFFHQGSTDEECCVPKYCSQYTTQFPSKWERKDDTQPPRLGSTDQECYNPRWCSDFTGCSPVEGKRLIAGNVSGSTTDECCVDS
eukprot:TRINITY_DN4697_c0_g1_i1.p1 TRINITY_DN4697_c0_g1~~TRINITY_DN4697_c0_g1_i1.p1  ORF type:complete len:611 (+),score=133.06 TRINITY_DN4697_c0_g1_i1:83-1915(+)